MKLPVTRIAAAAGFLLATIFALPVHGGHPPPGGESDKGAARWEIERPGAPVHGWGVMSDSCHEMEMPANTDFRFRFRWADQYPPPPETKCKLSFFEKKTDCRGANGLRRPPLQTIEIRADESKKYFRAKYHTEWMRIACEYPHGQGIPTSLPPANWWTNSW